jgi:arylsulfatase A-like enzyme
MVGFLMPCVVLMTGACTKKGEESQSLRSGRGVILISLDTVSAEHLSLYGYDRNTSPFLEKLEGQGATIFNHAYVQLPGTLPSHMSIFTSLYPDQHGVLPPDKVLDPAIPTLPQVFHAAGFRTQAFTEGGFVSGRFGFSRGFESYNEERILIWTGGNHVFKKAVNYLENLDSDAPFFLFIHTYAAHDPYTPPPECSSLYWDGPVPPGARLPESRVLTDHNNGFSPLTTEVVEYYRSQYDAEIHCLDSVLRVFFERLEQLGVRDDATIVITADHGEEFLEHGKMAHEQVYNENLHVPLVVLLPDSHKGHRVERIVESIDIAPTLYELAGLQAPPLIQGSSLVPFLAGEDSDDGEAFSRSIYNDRTLMSFDEKDLVHLVTTKPFPPIQPGQPRAVASYLNAVVGPGEYALKMKAYADPADVSIFIDDHLVGVSSIKNDHWTTTTVQVPEGTDTHKIHLETSTCIQTPKSIQKGTRFCLSFFVKGLPESTIEVFRTGIDRKEQDDLSREDPALRERLENGLRQYQFELIADQLSDPLDTELTSQLKALGYLE